MPFSLTHGFSKRPSVGRILLLAAAVLFCCVTGAGSVAAQTTDDHGNDFSNATDLSLGSSVTGRIDPGDDRDVFKLDLSGASGTTDVWIYTTGDLDTRGWLYDGNEDLLVFNDDSYLVGQEISFNLRRSLSSGVYYLSVRSWDGAVGDYTLHAEAVTDPGNTTGTAGALNLDSLTPGMIDTASDADYFRLNLAESKNLVIYALSSGLLDETRDLILREPLRGTVLDNTGAEISVNVHNVVIGFNIKDDIGPGTYYVKVTSPASDTTYPVPYTIHAYEDAEYTTFIDDCTTETASLNNPGIDDPLYGCQWHLNNRESQDINVEAVWTEGIDGEGVNIAVVDDTVDYSHEDLAGNINSSLNHDFEGMGGAYRPFDHHGTAVAGIIAARDNGVGVRGVAPRATVYGYNLLSGGPIELDPVDQAVAMSRNRVVTAISNNSWGPVDGPWLGLANRLWELAIDSGIREGYEGKGVFYVFAGGNGGRGHLENPDGTLVGGYVGNVIGRGDNSNLDELANYYTVTAVCAVNDGDVRSVYSEKGANLWVCAPSRDDGEHRGIVTTENSDRYRSNFGGTSAAAPIVSAVAALLRQANPDLTWRDLKLILAASARKNDATNSGWEDGARMYGANSDADRYHFNHEYGFGVVDAKAAVDLAREWTNAPSLESASAASESATTIPAPGSNGPETVPATLTLDTGIGFTEFVEVNTDFYHTSFRDMDIELVSPSGSVSKLAVPFNTRYYHTDDVCIAPDSSEKQCTYFVRLDGEFRFGSARHLGENPNGQWTLRLTDHFPELGGTLRSWSIRVYGHPRDVSMASPDREVLVSLYNATDGPNWANNTNWLTDRPPGEWHGVAIDADGRVTRLNLRNNQLSGGIPSSLGSLSNLTELSLGDNQLSGEIPSSLGGLASLQSLWLGGNQLSGEIPTELRSLANLVELGLWRNELTGEIPSWLGNLSDLELLSLSANQLTGEIPPELGNLSDLKELDFANNQLTGAIPTELGSLANLVQLQLSENQLTGTIPTWLGSLSNLEKLDFADNQLTGAIPTELGSLANLKELWLSENQLTGEIPVELGSLSSLTVLSLSRNELTGEIPAELVGLTNLEELWLADNQLTGEIPSELGNLSSLTNLVFWGNKLSGEIPPELGGLSNLTVLSLSRNELTGEIPPELVGLTNLEVLSLADNRLIREIPPELGNLSDLETLSLSANQLTGEIPPELGNLANMVELHLADNQLTGEIPLALNNLTSLEALSLWGNQLTGPIPAELGSLANLTSLSLSQNELTGAIPAELGSLANLEELYLWGNELTGTIPTELGSLANLVQLQLADNQLTGSIPTRLGSLSNLQELDFADNQLTGAIPTELGNLSNLVQLQLADNQLTGEIPSELGSLTSLEALFLWGNQLTGPIPAELGSLTNLEQLGLSQNQLTGPIPSALNNLTSLEALSLWGNQLTGPIPTWLGTLANLTTLSLSQNELTGAIPAELGSLANLEELYLWGNELTGAIPAELGSLANLEVLWLSDNQLSGMVPQALAELTMLESFSFYNNLGLCAPVDDAFQTWLREISSLYGSSCAPADSPEDRAVLVQAHSATDGANWTNSDNWLSEETSIREWYGVTIDANGRVNGLFLGDNQLTGEIPAYLGSLTELEWMSLSQNQLTGEIPSELGSLGNLRSLSLRDNQLTGGIPAELGNLANLEGLWLFNNQLTGEIPAELGNLANLERLRLFNNQLTGEIPSELGDLTNLVHLRLDGNQLTGEIPDELGRLTNLTVLHLSGNQLTGCVPASLRDVEDNDSAQLGLTFCTSTINVGIVGTYDKDKDGEISIIELFGAIDDYFDDEISITELFEVIDAYFG